MSAGGYQGGRLLVHFSAPEWTGWSTKDYHRWKYFREDDFPRTSVNPVDYMRACSTITESSPYSI